MNEGGQGIKFTAFTDIPVLIIIVYPCVLCLSISNRSTLKTHAKDSWRLLRCVIFPLLFTFALRFGMLSDYKIVASYY